jgi:hypothetical protein
MQRADVSNSRMITTIATQLRDQTAEEHSSPLGQNELPPSPTSSTNSPVFVTTTPRSDTPPSSNMSGTDRLRFCLTIFRFMDSSDS